MRCADRIFANTDWLLTTWVVKYCIAKMNEQNDFLKLLLQHQNDVKAFISSLVRDRYVCDDIFQDVALILWRKFDQFDRSRSFGAWARGIASKKIMQYFDKNRKTPLPLSPEVIEAVVIAFDQEEAQDITDEQEALRTCLEMLPEKSRSLLKMRYENAMQLNEIADVIAKSLNAVHKTLTRIRDSLRKCIEKKIAV